MKKIFAIGLFYIGLAHATYAQMGANASDAKVSLEMDLAATITADGLREILTVLASDEYEGRETGTAGQRKAADYIASKFKALGLPTIGEDNTYFQQIIFTSESWEKIEMEVNGTAYRHLWDFYAYPTRNGNLPEASFKEVTFLGYGIDDPKYSDYANNNIKDKAIIIYDGEPTDEKGNSLLTGASSLSDWSTDWQKKLKTAKEKGVAMVFIIDPKLKENIQENRRFLLGSRMALGAGENPEENFANHLSISSTVAKDMVGKGFKKVVKARGDIIKKGKLKAVNIPVAVNVVQRKLKNQLIGSNVLGFIEGTDPKLKEEVVVITAHYDHLGTKGESVFNGADDNGSGSSSVIKVAEAFVKAKAQGAGPRRSVLVMLVSGEEKGLLGSQYYAENPIFPLENTVVNVNVDMVGRVDDKYKDNPNYIYVIGSDRLSTELHEINEVANATYTNLVLDYTYNDDNDPNRFYYRSDHYNFAKKGIPAIFYFNGVHADYHRPSDTVEKINFEKMEKVARLVFHTAWELANRDKRIEVNVTGRN